MKTRSALLVFYAACIVPCINPSLSVGTTVAIDAGNQSFLSEMITPQQDMGVCGIDLQVTDFSSLNPAVPAVGSLEIYLNYDNTYYSPNSLVNAPAGLPLAFSTVTIDDATGPNYDFVLPESFLANTPYWLTFGLVDSPSTGTGIMQADVQAVLIDSPDPGGIVIDGYEYDSSFQSSGSYEIPITVVPEPATMPCLALGGAFLLLGSDRMAKRVRKLRRSLN